MRNGGAPRVPPDGGEAQSFIVRLWQEPREVVGATAEWRGEILRVGYEDRVRFRSFERMLQFVVRCTGAHGLLHPDGKDVAAAASRGGVVGRLVEWFGGAAAGREPSVASRVSGDSDSSVRGD